MAKQKKRPKIKLDDYIDMVRERAWYYAKKSGMEYREIEAHGFWIYCFCLERFNPSKASFSTFLYQNLSARLRDYCFQETQKTYLDNQGEEAMKALNIIPARVDHDLAEFHQYASDYLSPLAYKVLVVILETQFKPIIRQKERQVETIIHEVRRGLGFKPSDFEKVRTVWDELEHFWNTRGAAFYAR